MDEIYYEEENYEPEYIPAKLLPEGWIWKKYDDGSGCLLSPEKEVFMDYDLISNEYWFSKDKEYHFFPGRGFDRFEFMEKEILDRYINVKIEESKYIKIPEEDEIESFPAKLIKGGLWKRYKDGTECLVSAKNEIRLLCEPAKLFPKGWVWEKHRDGSGYLMSPERREAVYCYLSDNKYYFIVDKKYCNLSLDKIKNGIEANGIDPFEYIEKELTNQWLKKDKMELQIQSDNKKRKGCIR